MKESIYGVDLEGNITPIMVRDAILKCFTQAHCIDSGIGEKEENGKINHQYCLEIVKKAFSEAGQDFDKPTKEGILRSMDVLAEFSKKFRDQEIVQKNYSSILQLVNKLK